MNPRVLIGLAVALVVLVGLAVLGERGGDANGPSTDSLFLPGLESKLNQVDRVEVVRGGREAVATLLRKEDNWVVAEKDQYPADIAKVREVLLGLAQAHIVEQKTSNPEYYDRLGVESVDAPKAAGTELTLRSGDTALAAVTVGSEAGNGYRYVRRSDDAPSYLVDKPLDVPGQGAKWVVPDIVDVDGDRVRQVTITHSNGEPLTISKNSAAQQNFTVEGVPEGRELQYPGVANVTGSALRELRLEDVAAADASSDPDVTATFRTFDGLVVTVTGAEEGDAPWIEVEASAEASQADSQGTGEPQAADAQPAEAASSGQDAAAGADDPGADGKGDADAAGPDPQAEADAINARVHGWRYRIASYQYNQMTRRMEDLLKAVDPEE
jgi:hypothetical protein